VYGLLTAVSYSLFLSIMRFLCLGGYSATVTSAALLSLLLIAMVRHSARQDKASEAALHLSTLALYVGLHLVIVFSLRA